MHPPVKDQRDIGAEDQFLDCSFDEDTARQEFKEEADLNHMLAKLNVIPQKGAPMYGTWDSTIDLQVAIESVREARGAYDRLPEELRQKFRSMEELVNAVENGTLDIKDEPAPEDPKPADPAT